MDEAVRIHVEGETGGASGAVRPGDAIRDHASIRFFIGLSA
jgi:hypothetical protein